MKASIVSLALVVSLFAVGAVRAEDKALTPQQQKMATCSSQAKEKALKGKDRSAFMSECLKAEKAATNAQQQKMKDCNKQATGKKGDERKAFMKECLAK